MIPKLPADPAARAQRKANLLLASELMRGQAVAAFDSVGERADGWANRLLWIKGLFSQPAVLAVASGGAAFFAAAGRQRRGKLLAALRWGWLAWRLLRRQQA
ncbi:MAG TPA: hypothetical protein VGE36_11345 [Roseateles sp.]